MTPEASSSIRRDALTVAAVLLLYVVVGVLSFRPDTYGNSVFHNEAKALAATLRGEAPAGSLQISRAPGPSVFFAIPYLFVAPGSPEDRYWRAAFVWMAIVVVLSALILRRAGEDLGGARVGWLALFFAFVPPFPVYYGYGILAEVPALFGGALLARGWTLWRRRRGRAVFGAAWCMAWLGAAILIASRPNAMALLALAVLCAGAFLLSRKPSDRASALFIATGVLVPVVILGSSALAVHQLGGGWQGGNLMHVMLQGRFQFRAEPWDWRVWQKGYRKGSRDYADWRDQRERLENQAEGSPETLAALEKDWIRRDVLATPALSLRMAMTKAVNANVAVVGSVKDTRDFRVGPLRGRRWFWILHAGLNVFHVGVTTIAILSLILVPRRILGLWPLWAPWAALLVFTALTYSEPRYLFPGRPGLSLLAALFLVAGRSDSATAREELPERRNLAA